MSLMRMFPSLSWRMSAGREGERERERERENPPRAFVLIKIISEEQLTKRATLSPFPTNQTATIPGQ